MKIHRASDSAHPVCQTPRPNERARHLPIGAEVIADGGVHFRVWAPKSKRVRVQIGDSLATFATQHSTFELDHEGDGYFSGIVKRCRAGDFYKYSVDEGAYPDPVSRYQPTGPHGPSQVVDPTFPWTDDGWQGVSRDGQVIYEMHIGTFTKSGTWREAITQLEELANLGVTVLEVMPVAEFDGTFGWGYDGVNLFAPYHQYGTPDDFRAFVDRAHQVGLGVILDVVYNHFGPSGNYLRPFADDYFSSRHMTEWGEAINFDGENSAAVREFFISNAGYWIKEFHLDGLRLDATQSIFDESDTHIITAITSEVRARAGKRATYVIAENEPQDTRLVLEQQDGGYGVDALWNDDFHHSALVAATGRTEAYYTDYQGHPQEFISSIKRGFLYQGQWYRWQKCRRGRASLNLHPASYVTFLENHDQVANSLRGQRLHRMTSPGELRALTALLLLGPATPLLFQGQEFGASAPFLYFAQHEPELAGLVKQGRAEFLHQFPRIATPESSAMLHAPADEKTFQLSKLDFAERETNRHLYRLHRDLLKLRKSDIVFSGMQQGAVDGAVLSERAFLLRYFSDHGDRLLLINLGADLTLTPAPEPLLAPECDCSWERLWSSELPEYGGDGSPPSERSQSWWLPARSALVLKSVRQMSSAPEQP